MIARTAHHWRRQRLEEAARHVKLATAPAMGDVAGRDDDVAAYAVDGVERSVEARPRCFTAMQVADVRDRHHGARRRVGAQTKPSFGSNVTILARLSIWNSPSNKAGVPS